MYAAALPNDTHLRLPGYGNPMDCRATYPLPYGNPCPSMMDTRMELPLYYQYPPPPPPHMHSSFKLDQFSHLNSSMMSQFQFHHKKSFSKNWNEDIGSAMDSQGEQSCSLAPLSRCILPEDPHWLWESREDSFFKGAKWGTEQSHTLPTIHETGVEGNKFASNPSVPPSTPFPGCPPLPKSPLEPIHRRKYVKQEFYSGEQSSLRNRAVVTKVKVRDKLDDRFGLKSPQVSSPLTGKGGPNGIRFEGLGELVPPSKKRRRNSEKRKEKSRDAARCRRGKESEIFSELGKLLPLPTCVGATLDKASIIRVAIAFLRTRNLATYVLPSVLGPKCSNESADLPVGLVEAEESPDEVVLQSLDGFLLVLTKEGDIVYTSENIAAYLGVSQVDVMGQSLLDYTHPCDHDEVRHMASGSKGSEWTHCFVRFKCTLTPKGRNVNLKSATYKVVQMTGQILESCKKCDDPQNVPNSEPWVVALGVPVPHPSNIEVPLDKQTFVSKHSLDMKFTYVDENVFNFCGYDSSDLLGRSLYELNHALDTPLILEAYKILRAKGQVETGRYRFLSHGGGFVWVVTQATLITGHKDNKPQSIVCLNYVISEVVSADVIFSEHQLQTFNSKQVCDSTNSVCEVSSSPSSSVCSSLSPQYPSAPSTPIPKLIKDPTVPRCPKKSSPILSRPTPVAATYSLLTDRTEDMNEGYLTFTDNDPHAAVLKEEPEDLTHLAPSGGDDCVPLEIPVFLPTLDDYLAETPSSFSPVSPNSKSYRSPPPEKTKFIDPLSSLLTSVKISDKNAPYNSVRELQTHSKLNFKTNSNIQGPTIVSPVQHNFAFQDYNRFSGNKNYHFPVSQKVPEQELPSPLRGEVGSPGQRFNTPEPPRSPTPLLSQAASPHTPERVRNPSSFCMPSRSTTSSRPFAELDSNSSSMDFFTNLDLKLEEDLDLRAPYIPDIDEVLVFGSDDIFLANSSDHSNRSLKDDDESHSSSSKTSERGSSPFSLSSHYMDSAHSFHNQKANDTGGGFVDPNQVLPGQQYIKGEEGEDSSHELRYLLEGPPPSPVKETVDQPPPLKPRLSVKRGLSPQIIPSGSNKRIRPQSSCLGRSITPTRKDTSLLLPPPHSPIMQQLLVSKDPIQIRGRVAPPERPAACGGSRREAKRESASSSSHSVLRNLLVSGRDDTEGYNVVASGPDNSPSSPGSPQSSDGACDDKGDDEMCSSELDSLASIPLNRDGKVELTREQLSVLLSKAGVLRRSLSSQSHSSLQKSSNSYSQSSIHFTAMDKPFILVDPNLTIPSLLDLTSQDCEVNAPAPAPSLLHGADLLMALDQSQ